MAKKTSRKKKVTKKSTKKKQASFLENYWVNILGIVLAILAVFGLFGAGIVGSFVINLVRFCLGSAYIIGLVLVLIAGVLLGGFGRIPRIERRYWLGCSLVMLGVILWLTLSQYLSAPQPVDFLGANMDKLSDDFKSANTTSNIGGGIIAAFLFSISKELFGSIGTGIIASLLIVAGIFVLFNISMTQVFSVIKGTCLALKTKVDDIRKQHATKQKQQPVTNVPVTKKPVHEIEQPVDIESDEEKQFSADDITISGMEVTDDDKKPTEKASKAKKQVEPDDEDDGEDVYFSDDKEADDYQLPSTELLTQIAKDDQSGELKAIDKNAQILQKTLNSFGVKAQIKHVSLGPSVTKYELHPDIGVKVSRIVNLADDIALALAAKDIRIEAPIPGKSLIGIEVPNRNIATVSFRDVVESSPDIKGHVLQVPLGKDVNGKVITADLTKMPHLLIAGSTGSGKSVAINGIITSILLHAKPSQVKMMLIDPKKVELGVYNGIPHLLSPVVSEPKKAARALQKVVTEMENRYELFAKFGQRKISGYNEMVAKNNRENDVKVQPMPYIVVIVDELADLMMTVSNDVEAAIIRLAQMGRAAGIHMILATQRPSVDVITGLIKANVPSRIAFAVSSGIDSRTIIDTNGAEKLLGRGDMLFLPIDSNTPIRVQGAFISDQDVSKVVDFITEQKKAEYDESMIVTDEEVKEGDDEDSDDDLFDDALEFVVQEQKASTSLLQRHFRIGYNRAARLIDDLEQRGYIGPQDGSRPRKVYKSKE
ncbi:DNA translocase FtsK [Lentilactobacillus sp. Marseille-Q4993]|uniref:FtsK/SpoIIIE family DNA translocase n=1 Tax=Lentilactobacillus sp. Marseille-Q4993 TaxID=3039492 RepID=UPI0024BC0221|nr:DNA translocase FtsK [Lentilactobacillus sp. Marseille-Q4993]